MSSTLSSFKFPNNDENVWCGDRDHDVAPYILSEHSRVAIQVALATNRPLLIYGPPGCGKTTLAKAVAVSQNWNYLSYTLTSKSRLEDLTADIDHIKRLHDAQSAAVDRNKLLPEWAYFKPGLFWWGLNPQSAEQLGRNNEEFRKFENLIDERYRPKDFDLTREKTVLLLDEIDKAEPDLPNDLLEPIESKKFRLPNGQHVTSDKNISILLFITSNGERDLPPAFLRRCIHLELSSPDKDTLINIAKFHFGIESSKNYDLFYSVAERFEALKQEASEANRRAPGTSEFLDAVRTCMELKVSPLSAIWSKIEMATIKKA